MALPKTRQTRSRGRKRRTHYVAQQVAYTKCPQCSDTKMPHYACPNCGYYRGRPVVSAAE